MIWIISIRTELDKASFAHDADSKDLEQGTVLDKIFKNRTYETALNPKYGYQSILASMDYKCFDKEKWPAAKATRKTGANVNEVLAAVILHKLVVKKFKRKF